MSKATLDSDLYGDIYGDEDNDFGFIEPSEENATQTSAPSSEPKPEEKALQPAASSSKADLSLPAKPSSSSAQNAASLSYSAQIAQQFSAYQQTPSQERQQRQHGLSAQTFVPPKTSPIATVDSSASDSDTVFGKKPSEMHDAGKLFIGGLNWDTTDEGLRNYFSQFGKVDACTIMRDPAGTSRGFAFLTFEDPNAVHAVTAREHTLDGKSIDPKRAIPREEHLRNTRYFVGGLAPATSSESMKDFFSAYGKVVDATVMLDRESGRSKGFGFVTFEDAANTDQLVGKNLILDEKQIEVKMAQPRSQRDQNRSGSGNNTNPTANVNSISNATSNRGDTFENRMTQVNVPFMSQQQNPMSNMMFQRTMGQMPMMGGGMPMMNMNPMAMMGMNMNMQSMNPMANMMGNGMGAMGGGGGMNAMNMMGGGMGGMNGMNAMNAMGNPAAMRLGMGPMGGAGGMNPAAAMMGGGVAGMGGVGGMMQMRPGANPMAGGMATPFGRMAANAAGPGPTRMNSRGQHSFHPYSR